MSIISWSITSLVLFILLSGIRLVRPMERGVIERLGRYKGQAKEGFNWVIPIIDRLIRQEISEKMMDVESFEAITKERLNTQIDLVVFYKVMEDDKSVYKSLYKVSNFEPQVVRLAQTTARDIIGKMSFSEVNSDREKINHALMKQLTEQSNKWGIEIVRVETKEITPPEDVQRSMNEVLKAENEMTSAKNRATARETEADGYRRAEIMKAEGEKKATILKAEGSNEAFKLVNKNFKGASKELKKLEVIESSMKSNAKIVIVKDSKDFLKLFDINK